MRRSIPVFLCIAGTVSLAACDTARVNGAQMDRKFQDVNVIDETDLSEVMLTVADPNEGVSYFERSLKGDPDRIDLMRGLASSLVRAKRMTEGVAAWARVADHKDGSNADSVALADALIRSGDWDRAEEVLNTIPPTHETYKRYRLEAMIADSNEDWKKADSFYETAVGLTTKPAPVMNNWGYSKLSRGDFAAAERLFLEAIQQDTTMFTAKNNLALARGAQGKYDLPVVSMTQIERAQLLYSLGLAAVKRNDVETGKALFREAIDTHPQHFEAATRSLRALDASAKS
ncbi:MAG: hypothetical protein MK160_08420 [Rhodobacteraceae bacterium]|nr:hypothetical protein [Paracoccaceae bacterium]